jgi:hypothetical protein
MTPSRQLATSPTEVPPLHVTRPPAAALGAGILVAGLSPLTSAIAGAGGDRHPLYVESGGAGALDALATAADGSLSPIQTVWNLPAASEGIVAS